jgi:hypothetical protein
LTSYVCLLTCSGCNVIGAVVAKTAPEPKIMARYAPAKEPTLILVENYANPASLRLESDAVVRHLVEELTAREVAPLIEPEKAENLRQKNVTAYRKMPLDAIGRELGAKQVIYVDLVRFEVERAMASELLSAEAEARVRVVDTEAGEVLWPLDSGGGFPVSVKLDPQRVEARAGDADVRRQLHAILADHVAKLFYDWRGESSDRADEQF